MFIKGLWDAVFKRHNEERRLVLGAKAKSPEELRERMLTAAVMNPEAFSSRYSAQDKAKRRTSEAKLKARAVGSKIVDGKMRFARGKLIGGGQPRLFRP